MIHARGGQVFDSPFPAEIAFATSAELDPAALALLPAERALLGREASAKRAKDFTLGRACAHVALGRLGMDAARPILRGEGRMPLWPAGVVGSITHTAGWAGAAVAWQREFLAVGLDLERCKRGAPRLARRILRPEEREALEHLPPERKDELVTAIFSAKESIFKALNPLTGIYLGFQDASVLLDPMLLDLEVSNTVLPDTVASKRAGEESKGEIFHWTLHKSCGSNFPVSYVGLGRIVRRGELVLTGVWVWSSGHKGE